MEATYDLDRMLARVDLHCGEARWPVAYALLASALGEAKSDSDRARLKLALVAGQNQDDFKRGLRYGEEKHETLDEIEALAGELGDRALLAAALQERGTALHIEFIMSEGDFERELDSFSRAAEIFTELGDAEAAAMSTASIGVCHHVDRIDRETAWPILLEAHRMAPSDGPSLARAEAARHLGQIRQELGDVVEGIRYLEESVRLREQAGTPLYLPSAYHVLGYARLEAGDLNGAEADLDRARRLAEELNLPLTVAMVARNRADLDFARIAPNIWRRSHP